MCPSTDATGAQREFAADVLRNLLRRIGSENLSAERHTFLVSHAWAEGPMIYVVFTAPPSDKTWGLVRDTRTSIIDPGPWPDLDEAVLYYYLLDLDENWPGQFSREPGEPDTIQWLGDPVGDVPEQPSDIPDAHRYIPSANAPSTDAGAGAALPEGTEPRRYADPR